MAYMNCGKCRFFEMLSWHTESDPRREGYCRRYPPTLVATTNYGHYSSDVPTSSVDVRFPICKGDDWCGEFQEEDTQNG